MKLVTIALTTLCGVAHVVSQSILWNHNCHTKSGGSLYGVCLDERIELDTVPWFSSNAKELVDTNKMKPFRRNPYLLGDVEGSVGEAQVQAAREELGDKLLCAKVELLLNPMDHSSNSTISVRVFKYIVKDVPEDQHTAYWALPGGPGLGSGSMEIVIAKAIQQNLGSIIYVPDFRGSGESDPLRCYETDYFDDYYRFRDCMRESAEPTVPFMSVTNAAHDVISLIEMEHVLHPNTTEVRLHGFGFSTLWAQRIMQIKGDLIDKVVLEGAVSKSFNFNQYEGKIQTTGSRLLTLCLKDEKCKQYFPDGQQSLDAFATTQNDCMDALHRLDYRTTESGVMGFILNLGLKYGQQFDSNGNVAIDFRVFVLSIAARAIRCDDNYDDLRVVAHSIAFLTTPAAETLVKSNLPGFERTIRQFNPVIHSIVSSTEMWNTSLPAYIEGSGEDETQLFNARMIKAYLANLFKFSPPYLTDQYLVDFYPQDIETDLLVIGGELDGQTPIEYGVETFNAITVANGHHKHFAMIPTGAHIVSINSTCGTNTVANFFADPSKPVDKCAVGDTTKIDSFEHEKAEFPSVLDPRLSGSSDIWTGKYEGCGNLPSDSCSSPNIRACDACFVSCRASLTLEEKLDSRCECVTALAQCLLHIGCASNEVCLDQIKTRYISEGECAFHCLPQFPQQSGTSDVAIAGGVMMGVGTVALVVSWGVLQRRNQQSTTVQQLDDQPMSNKDTTVEVGNPSFRMDDL